MGMNIKNRKRKMNLFATARMMIPFDDGSASHGKDVNVAVVIVVAIAFFINENNNPSSLLLLVE